MSHENSFRFQNQQREQRAFADRARFAEESAAALHEQVSAQQEREADRLVARRRQHQAEIATEARSAQDWPEAFRKYKAILQAEIQEFSADGGDIAIIPVLRNNLTVTERAQTLWRATEQSAAQEVTALEARIATLRSAFRGIVAMQLEEEFPHCDLADAILHEDPEEFLQNV